MRPHRLAVLLKAILIAVAVSTGLARAALAQGLAGPPIEIAWWRVIAALVLCLALAVGAAFAIKMRLDGRDVLKAGVWRLPFAGPFKLFDTEPRRLRLVETLRLSHQVDICLIQCDERDVMVAATPHGAFIVPAASPAARSADPR